MRVGLINGCLGNLGSVISAFEFYKYNIDIATELESLKDYDVLVLAGVGNFKTASERLKKHNLWNSLNEEVVKNKKPILGICLGMQLFADVGYEGGETRGFGWIKGKVVKIEDNTVRVPHIGWNKVVSDGDTLLFKGIKDEYFYFMHSYYFLPEDMDTVVATTRYGHTDIVSCVKKDNIMGVQFHPEKSQSVGLKLIHNFMTENL